MPAERPACGQRSEWTSQASASNALAMSTRSSVHTALRAVATSLDRAHRSIHLLASVASFLVIPFSVTSVISGRRTVPARCAPSPATRSTGLSTGTRPRRRIQARTSTSSPAPPAVDSAETQTRHGATAVLVRVRVTAASNTPASRAGEAGSNSVWTRLSKPTQPMGRTVTRPRKPSDCLSRGPSAEIVPAL